MKRTLLGIILLVILALLCGCTTQEEPTPASNYADAVALLQQGSIGAAADAFTALGNYSDAPMYAVYCQALEHGQDGDYAIAVSNFAAIGDFRDSELYAAYYTARDYEAAQDYESRPREPVMWGFVEPLQDPSLIRAYERQEWVCFPKEFKELVASVNGAYPSREEFITEQGTVTDLKCLLSFNRDSSNSIWVMPDYDNKKLRKQYSVFAEDSNGNYICFQKNNLNIVWIDHETENVEKVAPDFESFLNMLF